MTQRLIGRTGQPFTMRVETGKVREFAAATRSEAPEYLRLEPPPVSPVTFLTTSRYWQSAENAPWADLGLDLRRMLHAEQEFVFHGPPPSADQVLHCRTRVDDVREKHGKRGGLLTFIDAVTEFRDDAGTLVAEARSTAVLTSRPPDSGGTP